MVETRICRKCGDRFIGYKNTQYCIYCSHKDEDKHKKPTIIKLNIPMGEKKMENQRSCLNCGKDISDRTHLAKYCVECSKERKRLQDIENHKIKREKKRGHLRFCKVCGGLVTQPRLTIHPECKKKRQRQTMKKWYKKYRKELGIKKRYKTHKHSFNQMEAIKPIVTRADTYTIIVINNRTKESKTFKMVEGSLI